MNRFVGAVGAVSLSIVLLGCLAPPSIGRLESIELAGEPYFEQYRPHDCGTYTGGFMCMHTCGSYFWKVARAEGHFEENVTDLERQLLDMGFKKELTPMEYPDRYKEEFWAYSYTRFDGVGVRIVAGPESGYSWNYVGAHKKFSYEGEYIYGVSGGHRSFRDRATVAWRNNGLLWLAGLTGECEGPLPGYPGASAR